MRLRSILLTLTIAITLQSSSIHADQYAKDRYSEDVVEEDGKPIKIRVDTDTGAVVSYWDDGSHDWAEASLCHADLRKAYEEKLEFRESQKELDAMKDETWDDRYRE